MNSTQQHLLDAYRAAQHDVPTPPAPGVHTVRTVREVLLWRRCLAVLRGGWGSRRGRAYQA
ncbi:hypothetical protein [Streptomyces sp. NPDC020742]|uniref:hypothetical protein n=1 Tax=unclassified Streptomyces TaxID=2593676 RepID=UPI0033ECC739